MYINIEVRTYLANLLLGMYVGIALCTRDASDTV